METLKNIQQCSPLTVILSLTICVCEVVNRIVFFPFPLNTLFTWHKVPMGVDEKVVKSFTNNPSSL